MKKNRIKYVCSVCGYESLRWIGKCPECQNWNTFSEEIIEENKSSTKRLQNLYEVKSIQEIETEKDERLKTGVEEFDRVLGGGLIRGSVVLIGGEPGIGKSTLVMQVCSKLSRKVLYVTGEESIQQIKIRADRLKVKSDNFFVLSETNLETIFAAVKEYNPDILVIDSIQTMHSGDYENSAGTVTQIRECTSILLEDAKKKNYSVIIIGHVTKEGIIAGPKILEHIVDTVIQFEGDTKQNYRILRAQKNRFGSTNEIGIFNMHSNGLVEVKNPSELFLSERGKKISGNSIAACIEGTRPILIEVQALVTPSHFGNPQRVSNGIDYRRLSILLAVIEKRASYRLSTANVFLNLAGGVRIDEPAIDLAICCSIISSFADKIIDSDTIFVGEIGLGGEVRSVGNIEKRIQESEKLGFRKIIIPSTNYKEINEKKEIKIIPVESLNEVISLTI
ncbi:MAG: DNA repair protein RadA [Ignavibacterium sp.]